MVTKNFWNDVDGHTGLHIGDKLVATIHQEDDAFYLVAVAGSVRYCYHKLSTNNLEKAKEETVSLLAETYWNEYMRITHEADDLLNVYDGLNHIAWLKKYEGKE